MATIAFYAGESTAIHHMQGSGLGFFGSTFGNSVAVGAFQDTTFITNAAGTTQGAAADNIKYKDSHSGIIAAAAAGTGLRFIPNNRASLNIRFTHTSGVKTQNVKLRIFDRVNADYPATGVTTRVAELLHPATAMTVQGSGDHVWWGDLASSGQDKFQGVYAGSPNQDVRLGSSSYTVGGTGILVPLANSPGPSGEFARDGSGSVHSSQQHDWYVALSSSPDSIGSKTQYGLYVSLEYL